MTCHQILHEREPSNPAHVREAHRGELRSLHFKALQQLCQNGGVMEGVSFIAATGLSPQEWASCNHGSLGCRETILLHMFELMEHRP